MSKKKYRLFPLVVALVFLLSNVLVCYASGFDASRFPSSNTTFSFQANFCCETPYARNYYTMYGNSEIVGYFLNSTTLHFISIENFSGSINAFNISNGSQLSSQTFGSPVNIGDVYQRNWGKIGCENGGYQKSLYSSMYIFDSYSNAYNYLTTGEINGLSVDKSKTYDSENMYLENFRVIYHDSNTLDNCYIEVKYNLPQYMTDNIENAYLNVNCSYDADFDLLADTIEINAFDFSSSKEYSLQNYPNGFNIFIADYVTDKDTLKYYSQMMLGDELYIDFDDLSIDGLGGNTLAQISKSVIYFDFVPIIGSSCGMQYDAQIDLLNPSNTSYYSSTPDSSGNYTTNNDYQQGDGYFTTIVGQDGQGNPTYNYYYYDNSKHYSIELGTDFDTDTDIDTDIPIGGGGSSGNSDGVITILWGNALEVEGNIALDTGLGGGSGGSGGSGGDSNVDVNVGDNIILSIEDDDYTDTALREDLKDGFGLLDDSTTPEYGDGFISVVSSFFNSIDPDASQILMFSLSCVCAVSILRSVFRR